MCLQKCLSYSLFKITDYTHHNYCCKAKFRYNIIIVNDKEQNKNNAFKATHQNKVYQEGK